MNSMPPDLLHVVGYLTGTALYAMLLAMAVRDRAADRLMLGTAALGLSWNLGELASLVLRTAGVAGGQWLAALSFTALGFLAAVVVHSVWHGGHAKSQARSLAWLPGVAYAAAALAGCLHAIAAAQGQAVPAPSALIVLTATLLLIAPMLFMATRRQTNGARAMWLTGLAVFTVSALHLGTFHGARESWVNELLGHHASIPLAFAILYQEYRFALADLFLKRALTLLAAVAVIFAAWAAVRPLLPAEASPQTIGVLLGAWATTLLIFPWLRTHIARFVDRVVLGRANYARFMDDLNTLVQRCGSESEALDATCLALAPALSAASVGWEHQDLEPVGAAHDGEVVIHTTDAPRPVLRIHQLAGGRRLLSDDLAMLHHLSLVLGRRIDAIRLADERYTRMLREREIRTLATEAELKALRAQINPHFLFNALTTIGYLIQTAPPAALNTLLRLTTLLRSVLRSEGEFTTLGREREMIEAYLDIERARFEERLEVRLDLPRPLDDVAIPALILQPLVENAIKHGITRSRDGGRVAVSATLDDAAARLRIVVSNTGVPFDGVSPGEEGGVGLTNVRSRLEAHYGLEARFQIGAAPSGETVAELIVPVDSTQVAAATSHARRHSA